MPNKNGEPGFNSWLLQGLVLGQDEVEEAKTRG